jgi:hypothetical protein
MRDEERAQLGAWLDGCARTFGVAPIVAPLPTPVPGAPADLHTITFPAALGAVDDLGRTGHFRHSPALVRHMRRLGYDWTDEGRILTAPTPSSFNALRPLVGAPDAGYRLVYIEQDRNLIRVAPWLLMYLDGALPIHVAGRAWYDERLAHGPHSEEVHALRWHFVALAHDLTVHAQNYHLVPHAAIADLRERIVAALPERHAAWQQPGATAPLTLGLFFDLDFNKYVYGVWCRCEQPSDFRRVFGEPRNYRQLLDGLAIRIEETRAGKGDVPSERNDEMEAIETIEFQVR